MLAKAEASVAIRDAMEKIAIQTDYLSEARVSLLLRSSSGIQSIIAQWMQALTEQEATVTNKTEKVNPLVRAYELELT